LKVDDCLKFWVEAGFFVCFVVYALEMLFLACGSLFLGFHAGNVGVCGVG